MLKLYEVFILPHLEYCSPLFVGIGTGQRNRLEDGNCYILRSLIGHKSLSYDELLTTASMTSTYCRRLRQALVLLLRTFARNFSNIDFFLKILPLKDDELAMSEMKKKNGGSPTSFWKEHARKKT